MNRSTLRRVAAAFKWVDPETGLTRGQQIRGNLAMAILGPYILYKGYGYRRQMSRRSRNDGVS